jgi:hypothetical protein
VYFRVAESTTYGSLANLKFEGMQVHASMVLVLYDSEIVYAFVCISALRCELASVL